MLERISDEEFERETFKYSVQSNPVYRRLYDDHKRAREAEKEAERMESAWRQCIDEQEVIIRKLEKENAELKKENELQRSQYEQSRNKASKRHFTRQY